MLNPPYGCFGFVARGGRYWQDKRQLNSFRLRIDVLSNYTRLEQNTSIRAFTPFSFTNRPNKFDCRLALGPNFKNYHTQMRTFRWSLRDKDFVDCQEDILEKFDLTIMYSFDQFDRAVFNHRETFQPPRLSCLYPQTKFLIHVFSLEHYLQV